jgi:D-alanyl-D-alanine carboxypeptidase/D-alanyl-D-alanine-endopeptidase (penicillin-binding protein 4)
VGPDGNSSLTGTRLAAPAFTGRSTPGLRTIAVHYSPPLEELLGVMNRVSHNLYSELFLFTLGKVVRGEGSFDGGTVAVKDYLVRVAGVRDADLQVEDGSGLSRGNQATASSFVRLLTHIAGSDYAEAFWATLPQAGNRLELPRMYRSAAAGNLRAKTGTIRRVSALTGVVRAAGGESILFSIVSNGVSSTSTAKWIEDQIGIRLASYNRDVPPPAERIALVEYGEYGPRLVPAPIEPALSEPADR